MNVENSKAQPRSLADIYENYNKSQTELLKKAKKAAESTLKCFQQMNNVICTAVTNREISLVKAIPILNDISSGITASQNQIKLVDEQLSKFSNNTEKNKELLEKIRKADAELQKLFKEINSSSENKKD